MTASKERARLQEIMAELSEFLKVVEGYWKIDHGESPHSLTLAREKFQEGVWWATKFIDNQDV